MQAIKIDPMDILGGRSYLSCMSHSVTNHNNIVFLRGEPQDELTPKGRVPKGHPRGVLLIRVNTESETVSITASLMSHTEPSDFDKDAGVAIAAQRDVAITSSTASFLRCENTDEDSKEWKDHHAAALEKADQMAWLAILATGATPETLALIEPFAAQSVLTAIIYALQGRGGVRVADAIAATEAKRAEQERKNAESEQRNGAVQLVKLNNALREMMILNGFADQLSRFDAVLPHIIAGSQPDA